MRICYLRDFTISKLSAQRGEQILHFGIGNIRWMCADRILSRRLRFHIPLAMVNAVVEAAPIVAREEVVVRITCVPEAMASATVIICWT